MLTRFVILIDLVWNEAVPTGMRDEAVRCGEAWGQCSVEAKVDALDSTNVALFEQ